MIIKANEQVKGGGSVGRHITYFSIDGGITNIAASVNWFDLENNAVGLIKRPRSLFSAVDYYIEEIQADDMEWGIVIDDTPTP